MNGWRMLWRDQRGAVGAASVVLTYAILVLGAIVGLVVLRNGVVQELGDLAVALRHLDQSFSFTVGTTPHQYIDTETNSLQDNAGDDLPAGMKLTPPAKWGGHGEH